MRQGHWPSTARVYPLVWAERNHHPVLVWSGNTLTWDSAFVLPFLPSSLFIFSASPARGYFCFFLVQLPEQPCGFNWPIFCMLERSFLPCPAAHPHQPWGLRATARSEALERKADGNSSEGKREGNKRLTERQTETDRYRERDRVSNTEEEWEPRGIKTEINN